MESPQQQQQQQLSPCLEGAAAAVVPAAAAALSVPVSPVDVPVSAPVALPIVTKSKVYATEDHWTCHRGIITRLYRDENKTLKEVKQIMEETYYFHATERMFKTRIKRWGLDKKFKEAEVLAMLQVKNKRDAAGKKTRFTVRNQEVEWERIAHYLKRRPDLQRDPRYASPDQDQDAQRELVRLLKGEPGLVAGAGAVDEQDYEAVARYDIRCRTPSPPPMPRVIDPAADLRIPDEILRLMKGFFDGAFQGRMWTMVDDTLCAAGQRVPSRDRPNRWGDFMSDTHRHIVGRRGDFRGAHAALCAQLDVLRWIIKDQDPELAFFLCYSVLSQPRDISEWLLPHICTLHEQVHGPRHPLTLIWARIRRVDRRERVRILHSLVKYGAKDLEKRLGLLNITIHYIHGLQGQLLARLGETGGSDFAEMTALYASTSAAYMAQGRLREACKCLFALAGLQLTAQEFEQARLTLERADDNIVAVERAEGRTPTTMRVWQYGEMGQLNYTVERASKYGESLAMARAQFGRSSPQALMTMLSWRGSWPYMQEAA
ncbi:hypothetical protein COL26b_011917 [Colletotrichum chrysophilum]|uniref:uncharacterized protein n=1 Tax=Colletotrichum chrysophilum TaxID=1836956 RepID=UPI0022FFDD3E|nr:uncharacterized protein COL26b_011917 [Colletotrichum chrysophilum]KAJ0344377.1 hypothetical protein KNSL1_009409 [Colletotrichum chrysophilum]KAJ0365785.1 hypothetical protein COL26b_011917 [Colletotrichum chrysophilum]